MSDMKSLTISHDYGNGTTVEGTTKNSPAHEALKAHPSWVWSRYAEAWLLRSSRNRPPKRARIAEIADILTGLGYQVEYTIDDTMPGVAEQEAHLADRMAGRKDRLERRAAAVADQAEASRRKAEAVFDHIPLGQPMLVDHHSYAADRRRRERAWKNLDRSVEQAGEADRLSRQAKSAGHHMGARYSPETVGNRIQKLEAEQRRVQRELDGIPAIDSYTDESGQQRKRWTTRQASPDRAAELNRRLADVDEELTYWREVYADLQEQGRACAVGPDIVAVGDWVRTRAGWLPVRRVNRRSVTVPNPNFRPPPPGHRETTTTVPWHKLTGHRRAADIDAIPPD